MLKQIRNLRRRSKKSGNIQNTNEVLSNLFCVQRLIVLPQQPFEQMIVHAFGHGAHRVRDLQFYKINNIHFFNNSFHCGVT